MRINHKINLRSEVRNSYLFLLAFLFQLFIQNHTVLGQNPNAPKVYDVVQFPAQPNGGMEAYHKFIFENLIHPPLLIRNYGYDYRGTVEVSFIVEKDGSKTDIKIKKNTMPEDLATACATEAIKVICNAPDWKPAKHNGKVVRQRVVFPVRFNTSNFGPAINSCGSKP